MNDQPTKPATAKSISQFTPFQWDDALRLDAELSEDERAIRDAAREFCQDKLFPRVLMANRLEKFDREIMNEMGEMGFLGAMGLLGLYMLLIWRIVAVGRVARSHQLIEARRRAAQHVTQVSHGEHDALGFA